MRFVWLSSAVTTSYQSYMANQFYYGTAGIKPEDYMDGYRSRPD
jgi:hypothetical protein